MSAFEQVGGIEIIRGKHEPRGIARIDKGKQCVEVFFARTLADHHDHAAPKFFTGFLKVGRLVVRTDARTDTRVERIPGKHGGMPVHDKPVGGKILNFAQDIR